MGQKKVPKGRDPGWDGKGGVDKKRPEIFIPSGRDRVELPEDQLLNS